MLQRMVARPHAKCIKNLDDIRTIGLIAYAPSQEEMTIISQFSQAMSTRGCLVRKLILHADPTGLDRYGLPKKNAVGDFYDHSYDILIDATPENNLPGLCVTLRSRTLLRIAYDDTQLLPNPTKNATYDLIIRGSGSMEMKKYLTDILTILKDINK